MIWGLWIEISLRWKLEKSPSVTPMVFPCFNCSIIAFFPGGFCHGRWCWVHCIGHSRGSGGSALARFRIADWQDFSGFPWFSENTELIWSRIIIIYYHILSYIIKNQPKMFSLPVVFQLFFSSKMVPTERGLWRRRHGWLSRLGPGRFHLRPLHSHRCHGGRFQENGGNKCSFFIINTCNLSLFFHFFFYIMNYFDERCFCPRSACFVWKVSSWHSCMIMIFWNGWSFVAMRLVIPIWSLSPRDPWLGLHPKVGFFFSFQQIS